MAAGIFLRIRGGVGRLREKTELSKYAAASGAGRGGVMYGGVVRRGAAAAGWGATPQGATATGTATGA
ncbi:MAG: hypothetical protein ACFNXY_11065 [Corynebacterium matruchotii]|uniref:hypothetical protein n=1 Tax=Corynebacterium matruchotii TaxID=43768 RepID=UPI0028E5C7EB|nr:hypothetical protein [Corynebacterium matruchotii]